MLFKLLFYIYKSIEEIVLLLVWYTGECNWKDSTLICR